MYLTRSVYLQAIKIRRFSRNVRKSSANAQLMNKMIKMLFKFSCSSSKMNILPTNSLTSKFKGLLLLLTSSKYPKYNLKKI